MWGGKARKPRAPGVPRAARHQLRLFGRDDSYVWQQAVRNISCKTKPPEQHMHAQAPHVHVHAHGVHVLNWFCRLQKQFILPPSQSNGAVPKGRCQRFWFPRRFGLSGEIWPTVSVRFAASSWCPPPEGWIISPAGYLVYRRGPFSTRSAPSDINIVGNRGQVNSLKCDHPEVRHPEVRPLPRRRRRRKG